jgi:HNH endonuclease
MKPNKKLQRANGVWHGHHWIRDDKRLAIWLRDGLACAYCRKTALPADACVEHVIPFEKGGSNHHSNLVTSCTRCNARKADMPLRRFARTLAPASPEVIVERIAKFTARQLRPYRNEAKKLVAQYGTASKALGAIA